MASSSDAERGLAILAVAVADERLGHDELLEVCRFVVSAYAGEPDAAAKHAGSLLCDMLVKSRRGLSTLLDRIDRGGFVASGSEVRRGLAELEELWPEARGGAPAKASAEDIVAAHRKALGETVIELPAAGTQARQIVLAAMKARGERPPGGKP